MQNLKITLHLDTPTILDRLTTIDGILLSSYYSYLAKNGKRLPFDKEHKTVDFIEKKNGSFSGSIWYIDKNEDTYLDFNTIVKKPEYRKIYDSTKKKKSADALFKQALLVNEIMLVSKLHFYIKAKKEIVESLLASELKNIGKKANIGFGKVSNIEVDEISEDKGFLLDENNPSKPLSTRFYDIDSSKVAEYRTMPPYWLDEDLEQCYMPTMSLYENTTSLFPKKNGNVATKHSYMSNVDFLFQQAYSKKCNTAAIAMRDTDLTELKFNRKKLWEIETNNDTLKCAFTKKIATSGIKGDIENFIVVNRKSFADFGNMENTGFVSHELLWALDNISNIGYSFVDTKQWYFLQGKKAEDGKRINDLILDTSILVPPFSINLKDTEKAQHVSFKGKVSVSNGFFFVQYGDDRLSIDAQLLKEAIEDIRKNIDTYKNITKMHLCGNHKDFFYATLKSGENEKIEAKIIQDFHKKYDRNIRKLLSVVAF